MNSTTKQKQVVISRLLQYEFMILSGEMCLGECECDWCNNFKRGCHTCKYHPCEKCPSFPGYTDIGCISNMDRESAYQGNIESAKLRLAQLLKGCEKLDFPCGGK